MKAEELKMYDKARENIVNTPEIPYGASFTILRVENK